ncbi:MAG: bifunctional metallophosphatase/5'-nucleotidase [Rubrimonas sp.]
MRRALLAATFLTAPAAWADTLTILHINDFHSRVEPISASGGPCSQADNDEGKCFGGAARLATAVAERRAAAGDGAVLFLNAGDVFQGSLFYTTYGGLAEAELLGAMGTDAMVLGNHEFDAGPEGLAPFLDAAPFPVIAGNVQLLAEPLLSGKAPDYVVLEVGGMKVGIVGALTEDTAEIASPGPNVFFTSPVAHLSAVVASLQAQGVGRIIALTHVGIDADIEIAQTVPGIDAVIGGHSHTTMGPDGGTPYPLMVEGPEGRLVPVAHAGAYGKYLGELMLTFEGDAVVAAMGAPILLDASVAEDAAVKARVAELAAPLEEVRATVVGEAAAPIDASRETCRAQECEMGALVTAAMLDRVRGQGVSIAIQNGGGLRAGIDQGPITLGHVLTVLPFGNTLATMTLKGADIVAALENGLSQVEEGAGRFPQVAGLRFSWTRAAEPGSRVLDVEVETADGWSPLDPEADYGVVTNDYMRKGGDGYRVFAEAARDVYDYGPGLDAVLAEYLTAAGPYTPSLPGLITEVDHP